MAKRKDKRRVTIGDVAAAALWDRATPVPRGRRDIPSTKVPGPQGPPGLRGPVTSNTPEKVAEATYMASRYAKPEEREDYVRRALTQGPTRRDDGRGLEDVGRDAVGVARGTGRIGLNIAEFLTDVTYGDVARGLRGTARGRAEEPRVSRLTRAVAEEGLGRPVAGTLTAAALGKKIAAEAGGELQKEAGVVPYRTAAGEKIPPSGPTWGELAVQALPKVAAYTGGGVASFRHPEKATRKLFGQTRDVTVGVGLLAAAATNPSLSWEDREKLAEYHLEQTLKQLEATYGPDVSAWEAYNKGKEDPLTGITAPLIVAGPAAKALTTTFSLMKGLTVRQALATVREPEKPRVLTQRTYPQKVAGQREKSPGGKPTGVVVPYSVSPLIRGTVERPYDLVSRLVEATPGLRRLPVSEGKRATRAIRKQQDRNARRLHAEARAIFNDVTKVAPEYATALAVLIQKPKGFTDAEFLTAALADMRRMLETGEFITPEERISPGVQRLVNRIRSYENKQQRALTREHRKAKSNIAYEQKRLSESLAGITARRELFFNEQQEMAASDFADKDEIVAQYEHQIAALDAQAEQARQRLDYISVGLEPVKHPKRDEFEAALEEIPFFRRKTKAIEDMLRVGDARAHVWARIQRNQGNTDATPGDWWGLIDTKLADPGDIPIAARMQRRSDEHLPGLDDDKLRAESKRLWNDYGDRPNAMPPGVKSARGVEAKGRELTRLMLMGWDGRDWYSESGLAIREAVGDNWDAAVKLSMATAFLSRSEGVVRNVGHALRAWDEFQRTKAATGTGDVGLVGRFPNVNREKLNEIFETGDWGGYKTNSFFRNILEEVDKKKYDRMFEGEDPATIDRWMVRATGYEDDLVSQKGRYEFVEGLVRHLAAQYNLTPKQAQAAIWIAKKAESDAETDREKVAKLEVEEQAKAKKAKREPKPVRAAKTAEEFLDEAAVHIGTGFERTTHQLRLNYEAAPGNTYGGFPEYATWTPRQQNYFARVMAEGVGTFFRTLGLPYRRGDEGPGIYEPPEGPLETNPAQAAIIHVGSAMRLKTREKYVAEGEEPWRVSPEQRAYYDGVAAGLGRGLKQNAQPWLRPLIAEGGRSDVSAMFREQPDLDSDQVVALYEARGADDWQIAIGHGDGGVWFSLVKDAGMSSAEFQVKVDTMLDSVFGDHETVDYAHEGGYIENDWQNGAETYDRTIGDSGRSEEIRGASDALSDHWERAKDEFDRDPDGAIRRYQSRERTRRDAADRRRRERIRDVEDPRIPRVERLNQTRQDDILGASEWLEGPEGRRVIYLTQNADASTVLHELVGHATEEMQRHHPDEFAEVERVMGKPYADWDIKDHERFADWVEQWFASGIAPTPELVHPFNRIKQWMRSIYGALQLKSRGEVPEETRRMMETYFGAYDDPNVARIAEEMDNIVPDPTIARYGAAAEVARGELGALQARLASRRGKPSDAPVYTIPMRQLISDIETMKGDLEKLYNRRGDWTPEERQAYHQLSADLLLREAEVIMRTDKREKALREKIHDLEKALSKGTDNPRFEGALRAMQWLAEDRERILKEALGDDYGRVFENRRDLLADWLVARGLLKPEFERGTAYYFPMTVEEGLLSSIRQPAAALDRRVVGKTRRDLLKLHKRNNMILWQRGNWNADPAVLFEAHARALGFAWMNEVKQTLYKMGRPLTLAEINGVIPDNVYLVNPEGTPLSSSMKAQLRSGSNVNTNHNLLDGLDGGDNEQLEISLKAFWERSVIDPKKYPPDFNPLEVEHLRVVPKHTVHKILRPLRGGRTGAGKTWDFATTVSRFALIYANVPGYMISNATGNLALLLAQQGWKLPASLRHAKDLVADRELFHLIQGETGDVPAFAAISRGRDFDIATAASKVEHAVLTFESLVDRYPRAIAWVYEAKKHGYKSKADMKRLLKSKSGKAARDRDRVSDLATEHMINFNRLSDFEKIWVTRVLFIWPFVRGATAWPFWYAKNFPERVAIAAQLGYQMQQNNEEIFGPLPRTHEDLLALEKLSPTRVRAIRTGLTSPTSMLSENMLMVQDIYKSIAGEEPDALSLRLADRFAPNIQDIIEGATGRDSFGRDVSLKEVLTDTLPSDIVPGYRLGRALWKADQTSRVFAPEERGLTERTARTLIRLEPMVYSIPWLNYRAQRRGEQSFEEKLNEDLAQSKKDWNVHHKGEPFNRYVEKSVRIKAIYEQALEEYIREKEDAPEFEPRRVGPEKLVATYLANSYERATHMYGAIKKEYRHAELMSPNQVFAYAKTTNPNLTVESKEFQQWMDNWISQVWPKFTGQAGELSRQAEGQREYETILEERKKAGVG